MAIKGKKTILGKNSLILIAQGEKEVAAQIFQFDKIREVRVNTETLEVRLLMTFDESYFRVYNIALAEDVSAEDKAKARANVLKFYNDLLNAASQFTSDDLKNFAKQEKSRIEEFKKAQAENQEATKVENKETTKEEKPQEDNPSSIDE